MSSLKVLALPILVLAVCSRASIVYEKKDFNDVTSHTSESEEGSPGTLNVHNSNFWLDDHNSQCNFVKSGKYIHYRNCFNEVELTSTLGHHTVRCSDLPYLVIFGTVHMRSGNCSEIVVTNDLCEGYPVDGSSFLIPCRRTLRNDTLISIFVLSFIIVLESLIIRWFLITRKHSCKNGKLKTSTWRNHSLVLQLSKPMESVRYAKKSDKDKADVVSAKNITYETFSIWGLFLLMIFFHHPQKVDGQGMDNNILNFQLLSNSSLSIGDFHLVLHETVYMYPLTKIYYTRNWWFSNKFDVDCSFSDCYPYGDCPNGGIHGVKSGVVRNEEQENPSFEYIPIRNCRWGNSKCWFSSGCDNALVKIWWSRNILAEVYSIEEGFLNPKFSITESRDCKIIQIRPLASLILPDLSVVKAHYKKWTLGPRASKRNEPELYKIGDIQWDNSNNSVMNPELISFSHSPGSGWSVEAPQNGYTTQMQSYLPLPSFYKADYYYVEDGYLKRVMTSPVDISLSCSKESVKFLTSENCGGVDVSISGIVGSMTSVIMHVYPKFKVDMMSWSGRLPCLNKEIQFNCRSDGAMVKIPWPNSCISKLNLSKINVVEQSGFVELTKSHTGFSNTDVSEKSFLGNLTSLFSDWRLGSFFMSPAVILLIGGYLILK